jgi:hypothetical protein
VAVLDERELAAIEEAGFRLGQLVAGSPATSTLELDQHPGFHGIFEVLRTDVAETKRRFPLARPTSMLGFRQFDARWFRSSEMSFALVGVFNRLDRRAFHPGTCGEVRFVYRLRYETLQGERPMSGYLPMTVNAVFMVAEAPQGAQDGARPCAEVARSWQRPVGEELGRWLLDSGPHTFVQTTAPISPGSSGGGLFDARGRQTLVRAAGDDEWQGGAVFQSVARNMEGPHVDQLSAVLVAVGFLKQIWFEPILDSQKTDLLFTLVDAVAAGRHAPHVLEQLAAAIHEAFNLAPLQEKEIFARIDGWKQVRVLRL